MTEEIPTPEPLTLPEIEIAATGGLHDGIVTATVTLGGAEITATYPNVDGGFEAIDTLYAALPEALLRVLNAIADAQAKADTEEDE